MHIITPPWLSALHSPSQMQKSGSLGARRPATAQSDRTLWPIFAFNFVALLSVLSADPVMVTSPQHCSSNAPLLPYLCLSSSVLWLHLLYPTLAPLSDPPFWASSLLKSQLPHFNNCIPKCRTLTVKLLISSAVVGGFWEETRLVWRLGVDLMEAHRLTNGNIWQPPQRQ